MDAVQIHLFALLSEAGVWTCLIGLSFRVPVWITGGKMMFAGFGNDSFGIGATGVPLGQTNRGRQGEGPSMKGDKYFTSK